MSNKRNSASKHRRSAAQMRGRQRQQGAQNLETTPFEVDVHSLSHDGRGIARWQEKTLFVSGALPGETVVCKQSAAHGRFNEAKTVSIVSASSDRVDPPCEFYQRCGGCDLQHLAVDKQIQSKQASVLDQMQRIGGLQPQTVLPALQSKSSDYRVRARLAVYWSKAGAPSLGFRGEGSKQVVPITHCTVLHPSIDQLIPALSEWLKSIERNRPVTHIELSADTEGACILLRHTRKLEQVDRDSLNQLAHEHSAEVFLQGDSGAELLDLSGDAVKPRRHYRLDDFDLKMAFHPLDFIQVNPQINEQMLAQALTLLNLSADDKVLDLFCGVGNFTLPMARQAGSVVGVEAQESMVERGRENAANNGMDNAKFLAANLEKPMAPGLLGRGNIDAILLDPPRSGAAGALPFIAQLKAPKLLYISCNPSTLARDAKGLAEQGYRLDTLGIMDMFPHTSHVESMALFLQE